MRVLIRVLCVTLLAEACGDQPALSRRSPPPSPAVLAPEIKRQLAPVLDVRAAEQFFQTMSQDDADDVLAGMGFYSVRLPEETEHVIVPVRSTDPTVQAVLDRMWAPFWKSLIPGAALDPAQPYPGRPAARVPAAPEEHGVRP